MSEQALVRVTPVSHWAPRHRTGLHRAAMVGDSEAVFALIQGGCAVDLQDRDGNTALHEASWHGFSHCVNLLVKTGADTNIRNKAGNIALHLACQNEHIQTSRLLLLGGSNLDTKNNMGETCLHVAARYNNKDVVKILIASQCSLTEKNQKGDTALHVAAALNHKKTVQLLLEAGVDANIKNNAGRTALDKARDNNHKQLAVLLARAPQVHRFLRGKTMKKQKEKQRSQSVSRVDEEQDQVDIMEHGSSSAAEDVPSFEQLQSTMALKSQQHLLYPEEIFINHSPKGHRAKGHEEKNKIWVEKKVNDTDRKQNLFEDSEDLSVTFGKTYQLYTLYRDKEGNIKQSPANGCHCKPLFKKLESGLKAAQDEMRLQMLSVQEQVNSRIGQMDRRNRHQIKVLDMLNQERVASEKRHMIYRLEQQAAQGREDVRITQAAVSRDLKRWCISQLKDMDIHTTSTNAHYCKLLPSPSVEQSLVESDMESLPLLSVLSGDSSTSLATYVNILPSKSSHSVGSETGSHKYFEMKVDRSPDDYENTAMFPLPSPLSSADPWRPVAVQDSSAVVPVGGEEGLGSSSSMSSISDRGPRWIPPRQDGQEQRRQGQDLVKAGHSENTRTLEFYITRPTEPSFTQERNNLHAVEVTQRFFETVSTQLELWYERKILEVEKQTELQAQRDKQDLLQRISMLEAELHKLKTNETSESTAHADSDDVTPE